MILTILYQNAIEISQDTNSSIERSSKFNEIATRALQTLQSLSNHIEISHKNNKVLANGSSQEYFSKVNDEVYLYLYL